MTPDQPALVLGTCTAPDCPKPKFCRGWCKTHYRRWLKFGDAEAVVALRVPGGRPVLKPDGYMRVYRPSHPLAGKHGFVLEHRMVVFDAGIDVPFDHDVHHINGDKTDNRLENLVVKSKALHAFEHQEPLTHCKYGHEMTPENTYTKPNGRHHECPYLPPTTTEKKMTPLPEGKEPMSEAIMRGPRAHSVTWMLHDDWVGPTFTCHAAEGADCRLTCPEDCESWSLVGHEHGLVDHGKCLFVEWMDIMGVGLEYHVGSHKPEDGFIIPEWDGDNFTWRYADA